jgi:hypothetical protein
MNTYWSSAYVIAQDIYKGHVHHFPRQLTREEYEGECYSAIATTYNLVIARRLCLIWNAQWKRIDNE